MINEFFHGQGNFPQPRKFSKKKLIKENFNSQGNFTENI